MIHFEIIFGIPQSGFFPIVAVVQSLSHVQLLHFHEWQHTRLLCLSMSPGVCSNSCSLGQWHHPAISSSVIPFSSCFQSFPASCSFQMSQLFVLGGQSIWSCSFGISPANEYSGLISFKMVWSSCCPRDSRVFSNTTVQKHQFFNFQPSLWSSSHIHT